MADSSSQGGSNPKPSRRRIPPPQVFINFRGAEARNDLLRQVVYNLKIRNIKYFTDTLLPVGEDLEELLTEIEKSKIAIVIFSKKYTDSKWCMEELAKIDERAKEGKLKVIPVFYNVSPDDVKNFQGEFGESFEKLKKEYDIKEPEKILKWKASVKSIARKKGLPSYVNGEPPLIHRIVNAVIACLNKMPGGKVKPPDTSLTIVQAVFLAFLAVGLCRFIISPIFLNDAEFFKGRMWVFGFPIVVAIWFHENTKHDHKSNRSNPSSSKPPPDTGPPPPTRPTPSSFKPPPPPHFTGPTPSSFKPPPPPHFGPTPSSFKPPLPPHFGPTPSSFKPPLPPHFGPTPSSFKPPPPPHFTKPTPSSFKPRSPPPYTKQSPPPS